MTTSPNGQQPQQALASPEQQAAAWAQWHAQQAAVNAAAQQTMQAAGIVMAAPPQPQQVQPQLLPGIQIVGGDDNKSPMVGLSAYEKQGKSTTAITSLIDWPAPGMHPLCIAWDPHGPDACVRLGYYPHVIRIRDQPGNSWMDKARSAMRMLHTNRDVVQRRYGSLVIDCASTCAMALHTDAQKLPKNANNPDTRAPYADSTLYLKEHINAVIDVGLPNIWLSWLMEGHIDSQKEEGSTQNRKTTRLGGPDIMGSKMRNFIAGKSHHNFILEKYKAATDPWGRKCDDEGSVRVFHSRPWGLLNAGGRYSHVLPDPCPANFGWILSRITQRGPWADK